MRNLLYRFSMFMHGRYGFDELNTFMLIISIILSLVSGFTRSTQAWLVLRILSLAMLGFTAFRMFSKNIARRQSENARFRPIFRAVADWFKFNYRRFKDGQTHRYYKCPACKAQLRVKNVKGKHTIRCPKCGNKFEKTIR